MAIKTALMRISGAVALIGVSVSPALAGPCGGGVACDLGTVSQPALPADFGPVTVSNHTPYDYFDSVQFQRAPHVSITRVHGLPPTVGLSDAPVGFTKGCNPSSTVYCRQGNKTTATSTLSPSTYRPIGTPVTAAPILRQPVVNHPVVQRPVQSSRVVAVGRGFDASKFTPRVYGDPYTITPGIAHVPTSIVDRNPYRAQAVLDAGPGGITPALLGVPVRPHVPPRLPIGYPAPVVASTTVQGQQALNAVTVTQGHTHAVGPVHHPHPPVMPRPAPYPGLTPCGTAQHTAPAPVGRYPSGPSVTSPCQTGQVARSRY